MMVLVKSNDFATDETVWEGEFPFDFGDREPMVYTFMPAYDFNGSQYEVQWRYWYHDNHLYELVYFVDQSREAHQVSNCNMYSKDAGQVAHNKEEPKSEPEKSKADSNQSSNNNSSNKSSSNKNNKSGSNSASVQAAETEPAAEGTTANPSALELVSPIKDVYPIPKVNQTGMGLFQNIANWVNQTPTWSAVGIADNPNKKIAGGDYTLSDLEEHKFYLSFNSTNTVRLVQDVRGSRMIDETVTIHKADHNMLLAYFDSLGFGVRIYYCLNSGNLFMCTMSEKYGPVDSSDFIVFAPAN